MLAAPGRAPQSENPAGRPPQHQRLSALDRDPPLEAQPAPPVGGDEPAPLAFDDARQHEDAPGREAAADFAGEVDERLEENVGDDEIVGPAAAEPRGAEAVAADRPHPGADPVDAGVAGGHRRRFGIHVGGDRARQVLAAARARMPEPAPRSSASRTRTSRASRSRASRQPAVEPWAPDPHARPASTVSVTVAAGGLPR